MGNLSALGLPVLDAVQLQYDGGRFGTRIVCPDDFHRAAISRPVLFNDNDTILRLLARAPARQTNHQHGLVVSFPCESQAHLDKGLLCWKRRDLGNCEWWAPGLSPFKLLAMRQMLISALLLLAALAQAQDVKMTANPLQTLTFLEGSWEARTKGGPASAAGVYTFRFELDGNLLARHSDAVECKGPEDFNCNHKDLLHAYAEGQRLKAIYFDIERHVIRYEVTTPQPGVALFVSEAGAPGPQFRLIYERKGVVMAGKFQMRMAGQAEWKSYLEWSGGRR